MNINEMNLNDDGVDYSLLELFSLSLSCDDHHHNHDDDDKRE